MFRSSILGFWILRFWKWPCHTVKSPEGSFPYNPSSSDAGGLEADASPLACSSPHHQSLLSPSSVLPAVSTASDNIPAPGGDAQYCPALNMLLR
ncbi:hypothetical protein Nepgr_012476 [Nepenthes gracilis]|uniref:Uncharacterized protein n=1 Tax=Nepenthes gracilis TaxID=150966 RepID=A0AAD3XND7_NEPGR|nr:hypothetical protein Nepgr_012476 [Nepenthes gracilis]